MDTLGERKRDLPVRDQYRAAIRKTLDRYLKGYEAEFPRDSIGSLQVISVGCQLGYEAEPVVSAFTNAHYTGIDIEDVRGAIDTNDDLASDRATFRIEDARTLPQDEKGKYGLVVIRHPQIEDQNSKFARAKQISKSGDPLIPEMRQYWREIFDKTLERMTPRGFLFVTTKVEGEEDAMRKYFEEKSGVVTVLTDEPNKARDIQSPRHEDMHVFIAQKTV